LTKRDGVGGGPNGGTRSESVKATFKLVQTRKGNFLEATSRDVKKKRHHQGTQGGKGAERKQNNASEWQADWGQNREV